MASLALFDFDGTITDSDSMFAFVRHCLGPIRFAVGLMWLAPMLVAYRLRWIDGTQAKIRFLRHYLGGIPREALAAHASSFRAVLASRLRPKATERIAWHRSQGHDVYVVSASLDLWLEPFVSEQGLALICSTAAYDADDRFTGGLVGSNVNYANKVKAVTDMVDLDGYETVYVYGDSAGDEAMLGLADEAHFKPFR